MKNWKTTGAAIVAILAGVSAAIELSIGRLDPSAAWPIITTSVAAAIGLFSARDAGPEDDGPRPRFG